MQPDKPLLMSRWFQLLKRGLHFTAILSLILFILFSILLVYLRIKPLPPVHIAQTTLLYDQHGEIFERLHGGVNRMYVSYAQIPQDLINATIAVEDRSFFQHFGFDIKRTLRAAYIDLKEMRFQQGASTISQQLARNLYLSFEKTWTRKLKEALIALQIELHWSKEEILEAYLNQIYYGHGAYGVKVAAQIYFNKDVTELSLGEAAMLAGIPKGPSYYSPLTNYTTAKKRQHLVLQSMVEADYITEEAARAAYAAPLHLQRLVRGEQDVAPYFRDAVLQEAQERFNLTKEELQHGGLRIYTTLDPELQHAAEKAVATSLPKEGEIQAAFVALDPRSGRIHALVGGREYAKSSFNRITQAQRHPGSTMKPILYLTALEEGFTPITRIESKPTKFRFDGDKIYEPINFDHHYLLRPITMQEAIRTSDNIYAVTTHLAIGQEKLVQMAERMGITTTLQPYPSLALGAQGITPLELSTAYGVIANDGKLVPPHFIQRIEKADGKLLGAPSYKEEKVAHSIHTFLLSQMMMSIFQEGGTGHRVQRDLPYPVPAKTGTTSMDAWMVGFTPDLVSTVWLGYDRERKLNQAETVPAAQIWARFMGYYMSSRPVQAFTIPVGVERLTIDPINGKRVDASCERGELLYVQRGTVPRYEWSDCSPLGEKGPTPTPSIPKKKSPSFWQRIFPW